MPGNKPTEFPMPKDLLDSLPTHATDHLPPATFTTVTTLAAPEHSTGPGEHFPPDATVNLPEGGVAGIGHAGDHLPGFISDWLLPI